MTEITYKKLVFNEKSILQLYLDNNWTNYTSNPEKLFKGIKSSLYSLGAYDDLSLVGLIRVVGDGFNIIYIQDILILTNYQHQGVGTKLLNLILNKYKNVRQIVLTTDNTEIQKSFYEKNNFLPFSSLGLTGFIKKK